MPPRGLLPSSWHSSACFLLALLIPSLARDAWPWPMPSRAGTQSKHPPCNNIYFKKLLDNVKKLKIWNHPGSATLPFCVWGFGEIESESPRMWRHAIIRERLPGLATCWRASSEGFGTRAEWPRGGSKKLIRVCAPSYGDGVLRCSESLLFYSFT